MDKVKMNEYLFLISLFFIVICISDFKRNQVLAQSIGSNLVSQKIWPKSTLQQALRQIRGFRPQSLSTARGFGKRYDKLAFGYPIPITSYKSLESNYDLRRTTDPQAALLAELKNLFLNAQTKEELGPLKYLATNKKPLNQASEEIFKKIGDDDINGYEN